MVQICKCQILLFSILIPKIRGPKSEGRAEKAVFVMESFRMHLCKDASSFLSDIEIFFSDKLVSNQKGFCERRMKSMK